MESPSFEPPPTLAGRLQRARRRSFVGRNSEIELFRLALADPAGSFALLFLYGPGGIGKTTLLYELEQIAAGTGIATIRLDGHDLEPNPSRLYEALRLATGLENSADPLEFLADRGRFIMFIDTYENLASLDTWFRRDFFPRLPVNSLVVIAGRNPPDPAWYSEAGWSELVRVVSLRNLQPEESRAYLAARGIPATRYTSILDFTHGHPLALSLLADLTLQQPETQSLDPRQNPDIIQVLLERFIEQIPQPLWRTALQLCACARTCNENMLAEILEITDAYEIFSWLKDLTFIEQGPEGVFPHDLAREVIEADLRWRNPAIYRELRRKIVNYFQKQLQRPRSQDQHFYDYIYPNRHNPVLKPFFDWQALRQAYIDSINPADYNAIIELVEKFEGQEQAAIAAYWLKRQPQAFHAIRSIRSEFAGFVATLTLHNISAEDRAMDPAVALAWEYAQRKGSLQPGKAVIYHRFWMGKENYQDSTIHNQVALHSVMAWLTTTELSRNFQAVSSPDHWAEMFQYIRQDRCPEVEFTAGGRTYGVFTHDWLAEPPFVWLNLTSRAGHNSAASKPTRPSPLSQSEFEEAVKKALRDYHRPGELAQNPLLGSKAIIVPGNPIGVAGLKQVLLAAIESLKSNPKDERFYRALWRTYIEPAPSQERAAELLNIPFSTYRNHLSLALERVVKLLWQNELQDSTLNP